MSVKKFVDAASLLMREGHSLMALSQVLIAVSGSARKRFPQGTLSDNKAFKTFLGTELRRKLFRYVGNEDASSGIVVGIDGKDHPLENIIYDKYRCSLLHEAQLSDEVDLVEGGDTSVVSISRENGKLVLGDSWVDLLIAVVLEAPCNAEEFGRKCYELRRVGDFDEELFRTELSKNYLPFPFDDLPFPLFEFIHFISHFPGENLVDEDDAQLQKHFEDAIFAGAVRGGPGLIDRALIRQDNQLTETGLAVVRAVCERYQMVEL
mgnify:CR=1 FL=1